MPVPLLVKDVLVEVSFGTTAQGGATPVPPDPVTADPNYECQAKSLRVSIQSSTVDLSTLCSSTNEVFETRKAGSLDMDVWVDKTAGPIFQGKVGWLCKVKVTLGSTAGSIKTFNGLVTDVTLNMTPGEVQTESVTIALGAWGFTSIYA